MSKGKWLFLQFESECLLCIGKELLSLLCWCMPITLALGEARGPEYKAVLCYMVSLRLDWDTCNFSNPLVLDILHNKVKWIMGLRKMYFSEKGKQTQNLLFESLFEIMIVQVKWNQLLESRTRLQSLKYMIYLDVFYLKKTHKVLIKTWIFTV